MEHRGDDRAFEALLEEYKFVNTYNIERQFATVENLAGTILGIGAIIAAASFAINSEVYVLLLVLALPFYVLIWEQLKLVIMGRYLVKYIEEKLIPDLNELIDDESPKLIGLEAYATVLITQDPKLGFIASLPHIGRTLVQVGLILSLIGLYFTVAEQSQSYKSGTIDDFLLILQLIFGLATLIAIVVTYVEARHRGTK